MTNDSLKEYYIKLNEAWNNALNVLTAINQSLVSNSTEVQVNLTTSDGTAATYKIPSFLYLENKLETLSNNFDTIFKLPESGEAWLTSTGNGNPFKIEMVRAGVSPISPKIDETKIFASTTDNNFLKDLVSPKTFLKVNIENLPENIDKVIMKKVIFFDRNHFDLVKNQNPQNNEDFIAAIYSLKKGINYESYESAIDLPVKRDRFNSAFKILSVDEERIDTVVGNGTNKIYKITVDTLKYTDQDDPAIEFGLVTGDKLCLGNSTTIFTVKGVYRNTNQIEIAEYSGHYTLQSYDENELMVLGIYDYDFSEYHYVQIPLEENPYICVLLATVNGNVRSVYSKPIFINLNETYMTDENGQFMYDEQGNKLHYMAYYENNCTNIGDMILGLTNSAYPQITNITVDEILKAQNEDTLRELIDNSIEGYLEVLPINKHVIDNATAEQIISMHSQKGTITSQINALNDSISSVNEKIMTTDFSNEVAVTQMSLNDELDNYSSEKILLQKQLIALVEDINIAGASIEGKDLKYRIRGVTKPKSFEDFVKNYVSPKIELIGIDVEYKYKSLNKDTTSATSINGSLYTDWNKYESIDKERLVKINTNGSIYLEFENYSDSNNIIKWNQIDIPIVADEDVILRLRYKYNIGQPFVNLYSPWSSEITVSFPPEYKDNVELTAVLNENQQDVMEAKFNKTLINEGYAKHINDDILSGEKTFFHNAANIYSGFATAENNLLSVKDKFDELLTLVNKYQGMLTSELSQKIKVYLVYDNTQVELLSNVSNTISIYNSEHITNAFVKKNMTLVFKNVGEVPARMYSIFPGSITTPLIFCADTFYEKYIANYERVPMIINNIPEYQNLGQWIYFRQNNPFTSRNIYYESSSQDRADWLANNVEGCIWNSSDTHNLMKHNYDQVLFGYRKRETGSDTYYASTWKGLKYDANSNSFEMFEEISSIKDKIKIDEKYQEVGEDFFKYKNLNNNYITHYEDIYYEKNGNRFYLDAESSIHEFCSNHKVGGNFSDDSDFTGAFLYPNLDSISSLLTDGNVGGYTEIPVGGALNVPICLEFYLNEDLTSVTKGLYFDIKPSSFNEPLHYMLDITALYDYTDSGNVISNISLNDDTIEI